MMFCPLPCVYTSRGSDHSLKMMTLSPYNRPLMASIWSRPVLFLDILNLLLYVQGATSWTWKKTS